MSQPTCIPCDDGFQRCSWCVGDGLYQAYHDQEWGFPVRDDRTLFEKISLEGFQAGLSWLTILRKRDNFRRAFADFDIAAVAEFHEGQVERLVQNAGIVRHRGKIEATINNARQALRLIEQWGSLANFFWRFEQPKTLTLKHLPSQTQASTQLSRELKRAKWRFVGPTTCYAFMQAAGLVNDHLPDCFVRGKVDELRRR